MIQSRYRVVALQYPVICNFAAPGGPIPHNLARPLIGPPTIQRSGSEHQRAVTSPLPEEEGLGAKVELSLQERRRGRKTPSLTVRKDGADGGISILDDTLGIDWKIPTEHANLSEKDTKHAMLKDFDSPFDINVDLYKQGLMSDKEVLE